MIAYTANFIAVPSEKEDSYTICRFPNREIIGTVFRDKYTGAPDVSITFEEYVEISKLIRMCSEKPDSNEILTNTLRILKVGRIYQVDYRSNSIHLGEVMINECGDWVFFPEKYNGGYWSKPVLADLVDFMGTLNVQCK